jgi:uncharacterized protein YllA (UPF0747 family)
MDPPGGKVRELSSIDLRTLSEGNRLFLDYVARLAEGIPPFLPPLRAPALFESPGSAPESRQLSNTELVRWQRLVEEMIESNERLGVSGEVLAKLTLAGSRRARFVVTGQQPGTLGGPLYVAYKLATTIALAERIEEGLGQPCIPLYWCGSDDTDFQEIREIQIVAGDLSVVTSSIAPAAHATGVPIGDIDIQWLAKVWQNIRPYVDGHPGGVVVGDAIDRALSRAKDHGELSAAVLVELFGGRFAVVDGRSGSVRRFAQPVLAAYVAAEDEVKREVANAGKRLEAAGFHAQLSMGSDSGVFVMDQGRRRSVAADQRPSLIDAVNHRVETCSPGVMARNLVQDYTFEPLAAVSGPAEIAYRAQMGALWERFGVPRPVEFPRMTATFLPERLAGLVGLTDTMDARQLIEAPARFAAEAYRSQIPPALAASAEEFKRAAENAVERYAESIRSGLPEKLRGKVLGRSRELRGRIEELADAVGEAGRFIALERWPFLSELTEMIRPGDRPQERRISVLTPFLQSPEGAGRGLVSLAARHAAELVDGRARHIVYSTGP